MPGEVIQSECMGMDSASLTLFVVLILAMVMLYRVSLLHRKKLFHLSLMQIFLLIIVPGFFMPMIYGYIGAIVERPLVETAFFSDTLLINVILISALLVYGGMAIHAVTKMMTPLIAAGKDNREALEVNRFFHLTFSHNMAFSSLAVFLVALTLLEINHMPGGDTVRLGGAILKGVILGGTIILGLFAYNPYAEEAYASRWSDLKVTLGVFWMVFMVFLYALRRLDPQFTAYQLLIPASLSLLLVMILSVVLVLRRVKRGGWRVYMKWGRLRRLVPWTA